MKCFNCGHGTLERGLVDLPAKVKGEEVIVPRIDGLFCSNCDYKTIAGSGMSEYMRLAADIYRRKNGLLTSDDIRALRSALRMSQEQFAAHLGVGVASVKRWELGQVQDVAMDRLIRVLSSLSDARTNYFALQESSNAVIDFRTEYWPADSPESEAGWRMPWLAVENNCELIAEAA